MMVMMMMMMMMVMMMMTIEMMMLMMLMLELVLKHMFMLMVLFMLLLMLILMTVMIYGNGNYKPHSVFQAPKDVIEALEQQDITANYHKKCLWVKTFFNNSAIKDFYNILATNVDSFEKWYNAAFIHNGTTILGLKFLFGQNLDR